MSGRRALLRLDAFCESDVGEGQALALRYRREMLRPRSAGACPPRSPRRREAGPCSSRSPDREKIMKILQILKILLISCKS